MKKLILFVLFALICVGTVKAQTSTAVPGLSFSYYNEPGYPALHHSINGAGGVYTKGCYLDNTAFYSDRVWAEDVKVVNDPVYGKMRILRYAMVIMNVNSGRLRIEFMGAPKYNIALIANPYLQSGKRLLHTITNDNRIVYVNLLHNDPNNNNIPSAYTIEVRYPADIVGEIGVSMRTM